MEEKKNCTCGPQGRKRLGVAVPFLIGVVLALIFGWAIFPDLMFSDKKQPLFFSHETHTETAGMSCLDCHSFRDDGSFAGVPDVETCATCHQDMMTAEPDKDSTPEQKAAYAAEKVLMEDYIQGGKELPWKIHQKQPDNVFFSHATHFKACFTCHLTMKGDKNLGTPEDPQRLCMTCHTPLDELNKNIPVQENVLTGYSRTTMKMWECESCHALPGHFYNDGTGRTAANNACYTCHK
jgi:hypothetical protein